MSTSHSQIANHHVTYLHPTLPRLAQDIVHEGYVNYQQALALGFVPTPQSLYTVIVTTIRDIHHPDAYNVAYLLGWLAAHYQYEQHTSSHEQQLRMATVHLRFASALYTQQEGQP